MSHTTAPIALTIAGSDPSAGAGVQADLKSFAALGSYGTSVISALTVQNTQGVRACQGVAPELVEQQLRALLEDMPIAAIKTGMLYSAEIIECIVTVLSEPEHAQIPLIVDTVTVSSSGSPLLNTDGIDALKQQLLPRARLFTPNLDEAAQLLDCQSQPESDAERILWAQQLLDLVANKATSVLLKGGHGEGNLAQDILLLSETEVQPGDDREYIFSAPRIKVRNNHGTGCTLSAAITAELAKGHDLIKSIDAAKQYITGALKSADALNYCKEEFSGRGSLNHFHNIRNK